MKLTSMIIIHRGGQYSTTINEYANLPCELMKSAHACGFDEHVMVAMKVAKFEDFIPLHLYVCRLDGRSTAPSMISVRIADVDVLIKLRDTVSKVVDHIDKSYDWFIEYAEEHFAARRYDCAYKKNCMKLLALLNTLIDMMPRDPSMYVEYASMYN